MNGNIVYSAIVTNDDGQQFKREVKRWYDEYQNDGKYVEVQYQTQMHPLGSLVYSALILARQPKEDE